MGRTRRVSKGVLHEITAQGLPRVLQRRTQGCALPASHPQRWAVTGRRGPGWGSDTLSLGWGSGSGLESWVGFWDQGWGQAHLERGAGRVVDIGQHLHRLLEHDSEGAGRAVTAEARVVLAQDRVTVRVDDLRTRAGPAHPSTPNMVPTHGIPRSLDPRAELTLKEAANGGGREAWSWVPPCLGERGGM